MLQQQVRQHIQDQDNALPLQGRMQKGQEPVKAQKGRHQVRIDFRQAPHNLQANVPNGQCAAGGRFGAAGNGTHHVLGKTNEE